METARGVTWFTSPETTPRNRVADNQLVRFVANNYPGPNVKFLDIGSGSGANARYLRDKGYDVTTLDSAPEAGADFCIHISDIQCKDTFDCIYDINTLCHVENPPYEAIYAALKPGGKFFSVHPANDTEQDFGGKGYTRMADALKMRELLGRGFNKFTVRKLSCWVIEAERLG